MTTTFAPEEVRTRRELMAFQITTGVITFFLLLVLVVALSLAYNICNREDNERKDKSDHQMLVSMHDSYSRTSRSASRPASRMDGARIERMDQMSSL